MTDVAVVNTQMVKRGDVLLRLDDSDARLALAKAEADLLKARRQFGQTAATSGSLAAQINARDADIAQARAQLAAADANFGKARIDLARRSELRRYGRGLGRGTDHRAATPIRPPQANLALARAAVSQARRRPAARRARAGPPTRR